VAAVWFGRQATIGLDVLTFLVSAWLITRMKFNEPHLKGLEGIRLRDAINFAPMADGFRYIARQPNMLTTVLVKAGMGLSGATWVLFPILGKQVFPLWRAGFTPEKAALAGMSALMVARGLGSALGPILGAPWAQHDGRRLRIGILVGFFFSAVGYTALAFTRSAWAAYAEVILSQAGSAVVWVFSTTLLQLMSEDKFRGRIFSAELACCTTTLAATAFAAGYALDRGIELSTVILATGMLLAIAFCLWGTFGLRRATRSAGQ
jgi:hypothetical protein